jgi:hypothetical protein
LKMQAIKKRNSFGSNEFLLYGKKLWVKSDDPVI